MGAAEYIAVRAWRQGLSVIGRRSQESVLLSKRMGVRKGVNEARMYVDGHACTVKSFCR